jgi:hypothetical protein
LIPLLGALLLRGASYTVLSRFIAFIESSVLSVSTFMLGG